MQLKSVLYNQFCSVSCESPRISTTNLAENTTDAPNKTKRGTINATFNAAFKISYFPRFTCNRKERSNETTSAVVVFRPTLENKSGYHRRWF